MTDENTDYVLIANVLKKASDFINDNLKKMTIRLAANGGFFNILPKDDRKDLTSDLEALKKAFDAFMVHYNKVKKAFECKLAKMCYAQDMEAAEGEFLEMWNGVENLKTKCRSKFFNLNDTLYKKQKCRRWIIFKKNGKQPLFQLWSLVDFSTN